MQFLLKNKKDYNDPFPFCKINYRDLFLNFLHGIFTVILALGKVRLFKETTEDTDLRRGLIDIDSE